MSKMNIDMNEVVDNEKQCDCECGCDHEMFSAGHCEIPENEFERNLLINLMDTSNICDIKYDKEAFNKGVAAMSEVAGKITALVNAGLAPSEAIEFIGALECNDITYKLQTTLADKQNDASIKVAEISGEAAIKQQF